MYSRGAPAAEPGVVPALRARAVRVLRVLGVVLADGVSTIFLVVPVPARPAGPALGDDDGPGAVQEQQDAARPPAALLRVGGRESARGVAHFGVVGSLSVCVVKCYKY